MNNTNKFHWMHVSDLHRGQENTDQPWATVRQEIHDDVVQQIKNHGPIDLVIFSGDLAFKGEAAEFESVKIELEKLWAIFAREGAVPKLFVIPGNHDLSRPEEDSPFLNLAGTLRTKNAVRKSILSGGESIYRHEIEAAFKGYKDFVSTLRDSSIPLAMDSHGLIPGDVSHVLSVNGLSIGLVGLNTAWTHLGGGDLQGKLDVYAGQLHELVSNDLPAWALKNHINFLVTHHPETWLNEDAQAEFKDEIFNPKYFDAHLFGHMHDTIPQTVTVGAQSRKQIQAASLFGLEKVKGQLDRRHGYLFAKLDADSEMCIIWPRRFEKKKMGGWQVSRDSELLQGDATSCEISWPVRKLDEYKVKKP